MILEISTEISSTSELEIAYKVLKIEGHKCLPIVVSLFMERSSKSIGTFITVSSGGFNLLFIDNIKMGEKLLTLIKHILIGNCRVKIDFMPDREFIDLISDGYGLVFTKQNGTMSASPKMIPWVDKNTVWTLGVDSNSLALLVSSPRDWSYFCRRNSVSYSKMCKRLVKEALQRFFTGESYYDKICRNGLSSQKQAH